MNGVLPSSISAERIQGTASEPATLVTDYLLGTLAEVSSVVLLQRNRALAQSCIALWAENHSEQVGSVLDGWFDPLDHEHRFRRPLRLEHEAELVL